MKTKMKKCLVLLLALCMVLSLMSVAAFALESDPTLIVPINFDSPASVTNNEAFTLATSLQMSEAQAQAFLASPFAPNEFTFVCTLTFEGVSEFTYGAVTISSDPALYVEAEAANKTDNTIVVKYKFADGASLTEDTLKTTKVTVSAADVKVPVSANGTAKLTAEVKAVAGEKSIIVAQGEKTFDLKAASNTGYTIAGSSTEKEYSIILPETVENGKLTASAQKAKKGATVTLTATPEANYKVATISVKSASGTEVALNDNGNGVWSFTMPESDVTAAVTFAAETVTHEKHYEDVPENAWYHDAVYWAYNNGITNGIDETHFAPYNNCYRCDFVTFLWRAVGEPEPTLTVNPFEDVAESDYFYKAVLWAYEKGITTGTDATHFSPYLYVIRAQVVTFLYRYEQSIGNGFTGAWAFPLDYPDAADVPDWAYEAFCWMTMQGIVKGSDGMLVPNEKCPRCQVIALIARVFGDVA